MTKRLFLAAALAAAGVGLTGCYDDGYGYAGVDVGYSPSYYSNYGYYDGAYGDPYWGWYGDYYYPGTGVYVYDRYHRPYRWNSDQQRYWSSRSHNWRGSSHQSDWRGFDRSSGSHDWHGSDGRGYQGGGYQGRGGYQGSHNYQGSGSYQGNQDYIGGARGHTRNAPTPPAPQPNVNRSLPTPPSQSFGSGGAGGFTGHRSGNWH